MLAGRSLVALALLTSFPTLLEAQQPGAKPDTAAIELPDLVVTVTRSTDTLAKVPAAIGVVGERDLRRGQATLGLDEAVNDIPGVYVANRYNYSLDQRLSIRGAGSRANFGSRGVKILLDGIPQTLPDGQSQLTNVDFGDLNRIEVMRSASSSLYGNASGGVINLVSAPVGHSPFSETVRAEGGSFGLFKIQSRTSGRSGRAAGAFSISRTEVDGFRDHSATRFTTLSLRGDYTASARTRLGVRFAFTDAPQAQNPGALTISEVLVKPDSAAPNNILRKADKDLWQGQLGLILTQETPRGKIDAAIFGFRRDLDNTLATPPPSGPGPTVGTFIHFNRQVLGARVSTEQRLGTSPQAVRVTAGVDLQRLRDDRTNARAVAGVPDTLILDQREKVTELGPFIQLHWQPTRDLVLSAGTRYDAVKFEVEDHHLTDGVDNSGDRTMSSVSANFGVSLVRDERFMPYANVSTTFETPTTTELVNQPNSTGGFNTSLDPQRAWSYELGARGRAGVFSWSIAGYLGRVRDAIVQYSEVSGRGYFTNAGKLHNDGVELGLSVTPVPELRVFASYTYADYTYARYRVVSGTTTDTLDGNRTPAVPRFFARLGLRGGPVRGFVLDLDHTMAGSMYADDQNRREIVGWGGTPKGSVAGLGAGVTNLRLSWEGWSGGAHIQPFFGVNNLWDREYVGSVTANGTFGRVYEPAPGRNYYVGAEVGWAR